MKKALVLFVTLLGLRPLSAWDSEGHMMVAYIAFQNLNPATKAAVTRLLQEHPDYQTWVAGIPADASHQDERLARAMMIAATWPDQIKSNAKYKNDGETPPNKPTSGQNVGYTDLFQHRYWHFENIPYAVSGAKGLPPASINAEERINLFVTTLQQAPTAALLDKQSYDLVWLLHLIGDIHQPLHCASRFTPTQSKGDEGGLKVTVKPTAGASTALHFFWDDLPGTSTDPNAAITAVGQLPTVSPTANIDVHAWTTDSEHLAETVAYAAPIGISSGPYNLNSTYEQNAHETAGTQLATAGLRLANILNTTLH
jgi:hypothetical protein